MDTDNGLLVVFDYSTGRLEEVSYASTTTGESSESLPNVSCIDLSDRADENCDDEGFSRVKRTAKKINFSSIFLGFLWRFFVSLPLLGILGWVYLYKELAKDVSGQEEFMAVFNEEKKLIGSPSSYSASHEVQCHDEHRITDEEDSSRKLEKRKLLFREDPEFKRSFELTPRFNLSQIDLKMFLEYVDIYDGRKVEDFFPFIRKDFCMSFFYWCLGVKTEYFIMENKRVEEEDLVRVDGRLDKHFVDVRDGISLLTREDNIYVLMTTFLEENRCFIDHDVKSCEVAIVGDRDIDENDEFFDTYSLLNLIRKLDIDRVESLNKVLLDYAIDKTRFRIDFCRFIDDEVIGKNQNLRTRNKATCKEYEKSEIEDLLKCFFIDRFAKEFRCDRVSKKVLKIATDLIIREKSIDSRYIASMFTDSSCEDIINSIAVHCARMFFVDDRFLELSFLQRFYNKKLVVLTEKYKEEEIGNIIKFLSNHYRLYHRGVVLSENFIKYGLGNDDDNEILKTILLYKSEILEVLKNKNCQTFYIMPSVDSRYLTLRLETIKEVLDARKNRTASDGRKIEVMMDCIWKCKLFDEDEQHRGMVLFNKAVITFSTLERGTPLFFKNVGYLNPVVSVLEGKIQDEGDRIFNCDDGEGEIIKKFKNYSRYPDCVPQVELEDVVESEAVSSDVNGGSSSGTYFNFIVNFNFSIRFAGGRSEAQNFFTESIRRKISIFQDKGGLPSVAKCDVLGKASFLTKLGEILKNDKPGGFSQIDSIELVDVRYREDGDVIKDLILRIHYRPEESDPGNTSWLGMSKLCDYGEWKEVAVYGGVRDGLKRFFSITEVPHPFSKLDYGDMFECVESYIKGKEGIYGIYYWEYSINKSSLRLYYDYLVCEICDKIKVNQAILNLYRDESLKRTQYSIDHLDESILKAFLSFLNVILVGNEILNIIVAKDERDKLRMVEPASFYRGVYRNLKKAYIDHKEGFTRGFVELDFDLDIIFNDDSFKSIPLTFEVEIYKGEKKDVVQYKMCRKPR